MTVRAMSRAACAAAVFLAGACAWKPYAGELRASSEERQAGGATVADDGTVTFVRDRLEVRLRPVSDAELERRFGGGGQGPESENPFTYGGTRDVYSGSRQQRFTVFLLGIKNYQYPKVRLDGEIVVEAGNGRRYYDLSESQLDRYFRAYAIGYRGNEYGVYKERRAVLQSTMFTRAEIFSGQESEGYLLFEPLHEDVAEMTVVVSNLVVRFDYRGEPVESIAARFRFERDLGRQHPDGRVEISAGGGE